MTRRSLQLHGPGRLRCEIVEYSVYPSYFIDDTVHNLHQNLIRDLCRLCGHEVNSLDRTECNGEIIGSFIAHNSDGTHVGKCREILVGHP